MPFLGQITQFINDSLKGSSLNKQKLQPALFYGLSSPVGRSKKDKDPINIEQVPAVIDAEGKIILITPDDKYSIQIYHKVLGKAYGYEKKSYGDEYLIKSVSDMQIIVITNSKISGKTKDVLEPMFIFGMPQKLSQDIITDLGINSCLITPMSSNMDAMTVFRQEYPNSEFFLNNQMSMFAIRYKIELTFSQSCIDQCMCE